MLSALTDRAPWFRDSTRDWRREFTRRKGVYLWDFDRFVRAKGYENLYDPKMWYVSRNPFRQSAYPAIADDLTRYVRSALGRIKKCVVLDLDNTLWGGIVGEDGIEGIAARPRRIRATAIGTFRTSCSSSITAGSFWRSTARTTRPTR